MQTVATRPIPTWQAHVLGGFGTPGGSIGFGSGELEAMNEANEAQQWMNVKSPADE